MTKREVLPEILDELDSTDARAIRSRRDLRLINALMGNERWILRELKRIAEGETVAELGSGRGELLEEITDLGVVATGYDLQARPSGLPSCAGWTEGNLFKTFAIDSTEVVVGSLILHHFQDEELRELGGLLANCSHLVFAEPFRTRTALLEGYALFPFVNEVTKHDMMVSIRAGFRQGELAQALGLVEGWEWQEKATLRGGLRAVARRRGEMV